MLDDDFDREELELTDHLMPTESQLCVQFMKQLRELQQLNYFETPFIIMHIANERKSTGNSHLDMLYNKRLKTIGMVKGAPDYIITYRFGKTAAIEFKRNAKCKLSPAQLTFKQEWEDLGAPYLLTWKIDEAIGFIHDLTEL
jgi:hypothetical protein